MSIRNHMYKWCVFDVLSFYMLNSYVNICLNIYIYTYVIFQVLYRVICNLRQFFTARDVTNVLCCILQNRSDGSSVTKQAPCLGFVFSRCFTGFIIFLCQKSWWNIHHYQVLGSSWLQVKMQQPGEHENSLCSWMLIQKKWCHVVSQFVPEGVCVCVCKPRAVMRLRIKSMNESTFQQGGWLSMQVPAQRAGLHVTLISLTTSSTAQGGGGSFRIL